MSNKNDFVPDVGDVVWLNFDPQAGVEQDGRRLALILSPAAYNGRVGLALALPITSRTKGYPREIDLPDHPQVHGVILSDQLRSLDWRARKAEKITQVSTDTLREVQRLRLYFPSDRYRHRVEPQ